MFPSITLNTKGISSVVPAFLLAVGFSLNIPAAQAVEGNGIEKTETRTLNSFQKITLTGSTEFTFKQQKGTPSIQITGDSNLLPLFESSVSGDRLTLQTKKSTSTKLGLRITLSAPQLEQFEIDGAHDVTIENLQTPQLTLKASGANEISISGSSQQFTATLSGTSDLKAREFQSTQAKIEVAGAGSASVYATKTLNARISGAGSLTYRGNPTITKQIEGVGSIDAEK